MKTQTGRLFLTASNLITYRRVYAQDLRDEYHPQQNCCLRMNYIETLKQKLKVIACTQFRQINYKITLS